MPRFAQFVGGFSLKMLVKIVFLALAVQAIVAELHTETFITQLDHFRPQDARTVNFTYNYNLDHYQPGGPFYVYIKDVADVSTEWIEHGLMVDIAKNTSGALFTYDARFFGQNIPTESADLESLQYLTPEQQLQDLATLIETIHERQAETAKTIVWGSGIGGTLATWARKKYPHLIHAAWSSSGVFDMHTETLGLYDSLAYSIHRVAGIECRNRVRDALNELDSLVRAGDGEAIVSRLGLCRLGDLDSDQEMSFLFETYLRFIVTNIEREHTNGLQLFCRSLQLPADQPLQALGRWVQYTFGQDRCLDVNYEEFRARVSQTTWNGMDSLARSALYVQCSQTGLFQITDEVTWLPNRIPLGYHQQKCNDIFGEQFDFNLLRPANSALAKTYGSIFQSVSRVLYSNGMIDPWFTHGIVYSRDAETVTVNIEHFGRSADLTSIQAVESRTLTLAKQRIYDQIVQWSY